MPFCWLLLDDRPGNNTQVRGVADALDWPAEEKHLAFTRWVALPNRLCGAGLHALDAASKNQLIPPWPDVVIAAGRRSAPVALWIKQQHPKTFLCQLMRPDMSGSSFDLLAIPSHNQPKRDANVLVTLGAPHRITALALEQAALAAPQLFPGLQPPYWTLLVGGDSRHGTFSAEDAARLTRHLVAMVRQNGGSVLATTSRRTGAFAAQAIRQELASVPHMFWPWQPEGMNPYLPMLGAADTVIVTEESVAMVCEASATGRPVYVFPYMRRKPFRQLHDRFRHEGVMQWLPENGSHTPWTYTPVSTAGAIAARITQGLGIS